MAAETKLKIKAQDKPAEESEVRKSVVRVPLDVLSGSEGIIAEDVLAKDGSVILPAGVDIAMFDASIGLIIRKLRSNGVDAVKLQQSVELSDVDIEAIISKVYSGQDQIIDKDKAAYIVKQVDELFTEFRKDEMNPEVMTSLSLMSQDLTYDIMHNPSVAFSLGKVRDADEYTFIHSFNVAVLCGYLANRLHPDDKEFIEKMIMGGMMHDIGKAHIPSEVLNKPGPLDPEEFALMQKHPALGVTLAMKAGMSDKVVLSVIGGHHEKWSGKGYPNKRAGLDIPEAARIAAVADVFDALTAKRVYKNPMSSRNAISIILKDSGVHFDARVARELLVGLGLYPPGSIVDLSDGRRGIVVSGGGKDLMRPVVLIQDTRLKKGDGVPDFIDLKTSDIRIVEYVGHGSKREMTVGKQKS